MVVLSTLGGSVALANPGDGGPGGAAGDGTVVITSSTTVAAGQRLFFAGEGFQPDGDGTFQMVYVKLDAYSPAEGYAGSANDDDLGVVGGFQVQADGTVSGAVEIPADIDDPAVNTALETATPPGPVTSSSHFLRVLGSAPAASRWTDDFTVDANADAGPVVTVDATEASTGRRSNVSVTVSGSGFEPNETIEASVFTGLSDSNEVEIAALEWAPTDRGEPSRPSITADENGEFGDVIEASIESGLLPAGSHQIYLSGGTSGQRAVAQVDVAPGASGSDIAQGAAGTVQLTNVPEGTTVTSVLIDDDGDTATTDDQVEILDTPFTTTGPATEASSVAVTVPETQSLGYSKTVVVTLSTPFPTTFEFTTKVSPSPAPVNEDAFTIASSADGAVVDGLYQSAYSAENNWLFATTAYRTGEDWDGTLYKLDPDTLEVLESVQPGFVSGDSGARYAPYGVGVDDVHGTVWVTNTRQNTVAVYDQETLEVLTQWDGSDSANGEVQHSRDVIYDPSSDQIFVTSASEGANGDGTIAVFEAGDNDGDGIPYEKIDDIATGARTEFSPMSLELGDGTVYTTSLTTSMIGLVDTATLSFGTIAIPDLADLGSRGTSGIAVDEAADRIFVVAQDNDEMLITTLDGTTVAAVPAGAGSLNVAIDTTQQLAYVANFGGTTVSVFDYEGELVANLPIDTPNHVHEDGNGAVFVVNKASGNQVFRITPAGDASTTGAADTGGAADSTEPADTSEPADTDS